MMLQLVAAILVVLSCTLVNASHPKCAHDADPAYVKSLCGSSTTTNTVATTTINGVPLALTVDCRNSFDFKERISKCVFNAGFRKVELDRYRHDVVIHNGARYIVTCCGENSPVVVKTEENLVESFCKAAWQAEDAKAAVDKNYVQPPSDAEIHGLKATTPLPYWNGDLEVTYDVKCFSYNPQITKCTAFDALTQQEQSARGAFGIVKPGYVSAVIWRNAREFGMDCFASSGANLEFKWKSGFSTDLCKDIWNETTGPNAKPRSKPIGEGALIDFTIPNLVADDKTTVFTMRSRVTCFRSEWEPIITGCSFLTKDNPNLAADATVGNYEEGILKLKNGPDFKAHCSLYGAPVIKKWNLYGRWREWFEDAVEKLDDMTKPSI